MKKKSAAKRTSVGRPRSDGIAPLIAQVRNLIHTGRRGAASVVDTFQVLTNFEIGRRIVEHEQQGAKRAVYGNELLKLLSVRLTEEFGRGFSPVNLSHMRRFYLTWQDRIPIFQKPSEKLVPAKTLRKTSGELEPTQIFQKPSEKFGSGQIDQKSSGKLAISENRPRECPFTLSWSHYVELLTIKDDAERSFYEIEATNSGWSLPELRRQKASCLYERLALSRDKAGIRKLAKEGQVITKPEDLFKDPFILEFLGLEDRASYSETHLESALISHLEKFLLELGKGFLFEARQKRFTFDGDHYFLDLVFYNRLLRCYLLIDLKLDKLAHQDLGQMQMYVNFYDRHVKFPHENPTIGLVLCKEKKDAVVKLTLPKDANIHAKEYQLYLPSRELLKAKLLEWTKAEEAKA